MRDLVDLYIGEQVKATRYTLFFLGTSFLISMITVWVFISTPSDYLTGHSLLAAISFAIQLALGLWFVAKFTSERKLRIQLGLVLPTIILSLYAFCSLLALPISIFFSPFEGIFGLELSQRRLASDSLGFAITGMALSAFRIFLVALALLFLPLLNSWIGSRKSVR